MSTDYFTPTWRKFIVFAIINTIAVVLGSALTFYENVEAIYFAYLTLVPVDLILTMLLQNQGPLGFEGRLFLSFIQQAFAIFWHYIIACAVVSSIWRSPGRLIVAPKKRRRTSAKLKK